MDSPNQVPKLRERVNVGFCNSLLACSYTRVHLAGALWACKRLNNAKWLRIWEGDAVRWLAESRRPRLPPARLRWLEIKLPGVASAQESAWFAWLLAQLPSLVVLSCTIGSLSWFPPMALLKHFDLTFQGEAGRVCTALACAQELVTLRLASGPGGIMELPELHLDHLTGLQTLVLEGCSPRVLRLTGSCALNLIRAGFNSRELERLPKNINHINFSRLPGVVHKSPSGLSTSEQPVRYFSQSRISWEYRSPVSLQP